MKIILNFDTFRKISINSMIKLDNDNNFVMSSCYKTIYDWCISTILFIFIIVMYIFIEVKILNKINTSSNK